MASKKKKSTKNKVKGKPLVFKPKSKKVAMVGGNPPKKKKKRKA